MIPVEHSIFRIMNRIVKENTIKLHPEEKKLYDRLVKKYSKREEEMKVTNEMVKYWLESHDTLEAIKIFGKNHDSIDTLTDVANGNYPREHLKEDISDLWGEYQYDIKNRGEEA